jgi:Cd2+/Zn2+-exporting ATPase
MARLRTAMVGGCLVLNAYLLPLAFPNQTLAAELSAIAGAIILTLPILATAFRDLIVGHVHMNELVALSILASMTGGDFRMAGTIAFFLLITIIIESRTASGAQRSIEQLIKLTPPTASLLRDGEETPVDVSTLKVGDVIRIRPGDNFPVDGEIIRGETAVDQSSITGESLPVDKEAGGDVFAGTQNLTGVVDTRVLKVGEDTTLGKVKDLILSAESTRTPIVRVIDQYARYYTPTILMIAGLTWWFTGDMDNVVAVLIVSCPCALVLASPTAVVATVAAAARLGILIKNVADIEIAAQVRAFVFDKTGTLTKGVLSVARLAPAKGVDPAELLRVAVSVEHASKHPVAVALRNLANEVGVDPTETSSAKEIHGKGVEAEMDGGKSRVGRISWLKKCRVKMTGLEDVPEEDGMSVVHVSVGSKALGWIGFRDTIREGAAEALEGLKAAGIRRLAMVTGDRSNVAEMVANELGIDEFKAESLPDEKVEFVREVKSSMPVAVVGDGVNDAPALASGTLGIAMGAIGSDIAINSASIALMNNDLKRLPMLVGLSRKSHLVVFENVVLGVLFVVGGVTLSVFGMLPPIMAAILHTSSTLLVLFNSARLVRAGEELTNGE